MKKIKVGILHRSVCVGDAIGNDILGSYRLLEVLGFVPEIVCEFPDKKIPPIFQLNADLTPERVRNAYDMLIYHHSVNWPDGEQVIDAFPGSIVIKYHNITPAEFFSPYTPSYEAVCRQGREQTKRFAQGGKVTLWQSDSTFNFDDLSAAGVSASINTVVPPFNRITELSRVSHGAVYGPGQQIDLLFVGRQVPNKGHRHLLYIISSYVRLYSGNIKLRVVGSVDDQFARYSYELKALSNQLGVTGHVEWLSHVSNQELDDLFRSSHVYVNASEHEGFCVPIIEAQAIGLPVITVDTTALRETTGINQLVCPLPHGAEDYDVMAGLVHEVATNSALRKSLIRHGFKNVHDRFFREPIENLFVGSLEPVLRKFS
jgi:glycosyltransferase involved in cell wall biosynthesis